MFLLLAHGTEVPKHCYLLWDSPRNWVCFKERKKVKINRVFESPYKFELYGHYTHLQQQQGISLSVSCTSCVLTQIFHELKWSQANATTQYSSSYDATTGKNSCCIPSQLTGSTKAAELQWSRAHCSFKPQQGLDSLLLTLDQTAQVSRKERRQKRKEFGAPLLSYTNFISHRDPQIGYTQNIHCYFLFFFKMWLKANSPKQTGSKQTLIFHSDSYQFCFWSSFKHFPASVSKHFPPHKRKTPEEVPRERCPQIGV